MTPGVVCEREVPHAADAAAAAAAAHKSERKRLRQERRRIAWQPADSAAPIEALPTPTTSTEPASPRAAAHRPAAASPGGEKSAKRRAAEGLLAERAAQRQRACVSPAAGTGTAGAAAPRDVAVPACGCAGGAAWCGVPVSLPALDWAAALAPAAPAAPAAHPRGAGGAALLPGGLRALVVERLADLAPALLELRASLAAGDLVLGVDLEWRPDVRKGSCNKVALLQLASARLAVLVRVCALGFRLPPPLAAFLADPALTFVGYGWDGGDEGKAVATFGAGRALFARLLDLQVVAGELGYARAGGLGGLARRLLGVAPPKSRKVGRSDWTARGGLAPAQVRYAALDALVTVAAYRALRLWHASPSACPGCAQPLGVPPAGAARACCAECGHACRGLDALRNHAQQTGHRCGAAECGECGRSSGAAGAII
jgi:hypothetical protein